MNVRLLVLAVLVLFAPFIGAANSWERLYFQENDGWITSILRTTDGYVLAGHVFATVTGSSIIKIDTKGDVIWQTHIESIPIARGLIRNNNGGYAVIGEVSGANGIVGVGFAAVDESGQIILEKKFFDFNVNEMRPVSICQNGNGHYFIAGTGTIKSHRTEDILVLKLSAYGDYEWLVNYGSDEYSDNGNQIILCRDGNMVVCGMRGSQNTSGDACLIKINGNGDPIWEKIYASAGGQFAISVQQTPDDGFIITGYDTWVPSPDWNLRTNALVIKTDATGDMRWRNSFGGKQIDFGQQVIVEPLGGYVIAGYSDIIDDGSYKGTDAFLIKIDNNGNEVWTKNFNEGARDAFYSVALANDSGYLAVGYTDYSAVNMPRWYVVKTDAHGEVPAHFIRGDADSNGRINIADGIVTLCFVLNISRDGCQDAMDVNDDGKLEIADAINILNYILKDGFQPKMPFPSPRFDATLDELNCD